MRLSELSEENSLYRSLLNLKPQFAAAAQSIYDSWDQTDEYDEFGGGGICDAISQAISEILSSNNIDYTEGGHDGDDHSYIIAYNDSESYIIDIPYNVYETGGGYNWSKIDNVIFNENDIIISEVDRPDWIDRSY